MSQTTLLEAPIADRQIVYSGITWQQFKLIQSGFAESPGIRLTYYNNTIEILMPGRTHEFFKSIIGMLIELFCIEMSVEFEPTGSMTQEREGEVAIEADESYCFGISKPTPDLAVEIVFSSGNINKLQRYQILKVPEVWFWEDGLFQIYHLGDRGYELVTSSEIPELKFLDIELLTRCVLIAQTSRLNAVTEFRQGIKTRSI